jgi:hypothetical protein
MRLVAGPPATRAEASGFFDKSTSGSARPPDGAALKSTYTACIRSFASARAPMVNCRLRSASRTSWRRGRPPKPGSIAAFAMQHTITVRSGGGCVMLSYPRYAHQKSLTKGCVIAAVLSARVIKNKRPSLPIILMSAHPELLKPIASCVRRPRCSAPRSVIRVASNFRPDIAASRGSPSDLD